jgi:hypothetical protein
VHNSNGSAFWRRKLVSPTGLFLALMLLFMPFAGVACAGFEAEISGWDMAVGGESSVSIDGSDTSTRYIHGADDIPVQPLMLVTVVLMLTGIVVGLAVRPAYNRALCGLIVVALTALSLGLNEAIVLDKLVSEVASSNDMTEGNAAKIVGTRSGFWLTLTLSLAILAYHAIELRREGRRRASQARLDDHGPPPAYPYPNTPRRGEQ